MDKLGNTTVHHAEDGNIIFSYKLIKMKNTMLHFVVPLVILIALIIFWLPSLQLFPLILIILLLAIFLLAILLYRWTIVTDKKNLSIEKETIYEYLNPLIKNDIFSNFGDSIKEIERRYHYEQKDYEEKRFVSVLLSNGKEFRYHIINPKSYGNKLLLEINTKVEIVD